MFFVKIGKSDENHEEVGKIVKIKTRSLLVSKAQRGIFIQ
jgi:hypothetical protein